MNLAEEEENIKKVENIRLNKQTISIKEHLTLKKDAKRSQKKENRRTTSNITKKSKRKQEQQAEQEK